MKPGARLKSAVCDTEVMVIRGSGAVVECGGVPMAADRPAPHRDVPVPRAQDAQERPQRAAINPGLAQPTQIGKRYVDAADSIELLCVKPGQGSLSVGGVALRVKEAKPLPSSD